MAGVILGGICVIWTSVTGWTLATAGLTRTTQVTLGERNVSVFSDFIISLQIILERDVK